MIEKTIHTIMKQKIDELENYNYDKETIDTTMKAHLNKYLENYKTVDLKDINLVKPSISDLILYLVYLWQNQKQNDVEALNSINELVDFKISVHKDELDINEIDNIFELFKTQIQLK